MKKRRLSRPKQTAQNLLLTGLVLLLTWLLAGFSPLTKGMMAADIARRNLLPEAEIIYESKDRHGDDLMYLQQGDEFLRFGYQRIFPFYGEWSARHFTAKDGVICLPDQETMGVMLALGDLTDAWWAELEMYASLDRELPRELHWTVEGERGADRVFRFVLPERSHEETLLVEALRKDGYPEAYYDWTLRLYGGDGELLRTLTGPVREE